jgi:HEAT repeat protein
MIDPHLSRVHRILDRLEQARSRGLSCFGSESHGFRLNHPLSEADLRAFEAAHRIRLPGDYRAFLEHAGNGGAGPYYGIFPLDKWNDFADSVSDERPDDFLARPCPLHPDIRLAPDWADQFGDVSPYQGTLSLGTQGCAYGMLLIVSGPHAGRVVYVNEDGNPPYMVREPDFLSWYERWLDELLHGYKTGWFGYGPGGGEDDFFHILNDPQAGNDFKSEAARAFCRLPRLSETAAARVPAYCSHPVEGVRAGACATIRAFEIRHAGDEAARLLDDSSPAVRREAVWTVMTLDPRRWTDAVLHRLREDPSEDVAASAFFKLKDAGALPKPELLRIIERSPSGNLRYLAAHGVKWAAEDLGLLIRMLSDSNAQVRFSATLGLRQLKAHDALHRVLDMLAREKDALVIGSILMLLGEFGDPSAVPSLLAWAESPDDFHRLDAIEALAKIGDDRAVPIAKAMLLEDRKPVRRDARGFPKQSSVHSIGTLVRKGLRESPNPSLRALAE